MKILKKTQGLTIKQRAFVSNISKGFNQSQSARLAGYSRTNADVMGSRLIRDTKIIQALDKIGVNDDMLATSIKANIVEGTGVKATADTATKNIELVLKLKGYLSKEEAPTINNNTMYIQELNNLSDNELQQRLNGLQEVVGTTTN